MTERRIACAVVAVALASSGCGGCNGGGGGNGPSGPTVHDTDVTSNETWHASGNPHIVQDCLYVGGDTSTVATLTIEDGAEVRFGPDGCLIIGETDMMGSINAVASTPGGIVFTAHHGVPSRGYWRGIILGEQAQPSTLSGVIIEYAGQVGVGAASGPNFIDAALLGWGDNTPGPTMLLTDVTIRESATAGLGLVGAFALEAGSTNLVSTANDGYSAHIEAEVAHTLPTGPGSDYTGNGSDAIYLVSGNGHILTTGARDWGDPGVPYVVAENLTIDGADLNIEVNTDIRVENQGEIEVLSGSFSAQSATFAGWPTDDTLWGGIYYDVPGTGSISNSTIRYGGNRSVGNSAGFNIYVDDFDQLGTGLPTITNNTIADSTNDGISAWFVNVASYQNNTFTNNQGNDIYDYFDDEAYNQ